MMLTTGFQLCLAHYCDVHGPTPLMVTEGLPVPCGVCYDGDLPARAGINRSHSPRTSPAAAAAAASDAAALAAALRRLDRPGAARGPSAERDAQQGPPPQPARRESQYNKTYDEHTKRRAGPCENCALTLPRLQEAGGHRGSGGSPDAGPTLRTRAPYARVYGGGGGGGSASASASASGGSASPPTSTSTSTSTDTEDDEQHPPRRALHHRRAGTAASALSRSSSGSSARLSTHTHYLDYTSTHEPVVPSSYSLVRASCLRTLSFETLPRHAAGGGGTPTAGPGPASPGAALAAAAPAPPFVTTHSPGTAAAGGPIFFGDPAAGYTTAYIFRLPDVHARGHKRVYAFLALSTHRERQAMRAFSLVAAAFRDLAAWIQQLAEAAAERACDESSAASSPGAGAVSASSSQAAAAAAEAANAGYGGGGGGGPAASQPGAGAGAAGGSSFLTGGVGGMSRRMVGGFGGSGVSLRARGLPELVGMPDFFIELHARFVRLLLELGVLLNS